MADLGAIGARGGFSAPATPPAVVAGSARGTLPLRLLGYISAPLVGAVDWTGTDTGFPVALPPPLITGYQLAPADQTARTELDVGADRVRRRSQALNDRVQITWKFTDAEMALFRDWFDNAARGGAAWFAGLQLALGRTGIQTTEARFVGPFRADLQPGLTWQVSAAVEVR